MYHLYLTCYFLISASFRVCMVSSLTVTGEVGETVTLPCRYDTERYSLTSTCWGRGQLPLSKCSNTVISTGDRGTVTSRESTRYRLQSGVTEGDVSLTILDAQESDAGLYGCRVEVPGWFNDLKFNVRLIITSGETSPPVEVESYDDPVVDSVHSQESPTFWIENTVRIGAVISVPVLFTILIRVMRSLKKKSMIEAD